MNHKEIVVKNQKIKHKFDKKLINCSFTTTNNINNSTVMAAATYPCVIMGIVITGGSTTVVATASRVSWALVVVEEGTTISNITQSAAGTLYAPEQQVLCFGSGICSSTTSTQFHVKTKTGRKIRTGDTVVLTTVSDVAAQLVTSNFTIQYFLKI